MIHIEDVGFIVPYDEPMLEYHTNLDSVENRSVLHLLEKMGFDIQKSSGEGVYDLDTAFRQ